MSKRSRFTRVIAGLAPLVVSASIRSWVWYNYVPGIIDVWHMALLPLLLLPIDGGVAAVYGFWSGEKLLAVLVGFLPSTVSSLVAVIRFSSNVGGVWFSLLLGLGMGVMGFGGSKCKATGSPLWLVAGCVLWVLTLLTGLLSGSH